MSRSRPCVARAAVVAASLATLLAAGPAAAQVAPYTADLPLPGQAVQDSTGRYVLTMSEVSQKLHPDLPATRVWGFDGGTPGPTIEATKDVPARVNWVKMLPLTHLLAVDTSLTKGYGAVTRTQTHLHGGSVSGLSDGNPYAQEVVANTFRVNYPNAQPGATLWYHDHALGLTRLNVYAGLAGFDLLRDAQDTGRSGNPLGLPAGRYEIPLVFQDRTLTPDAQLSYPATWTPEFFGDTAVVNGAIWPRLQVEPRLYRFRILNGANSRFFRLQFPSTSGLRFKQIGSDGGRFDVPVDLGRSLLLAPGERADVLVDFAPARGTQVLLRNGRLPAGVVSPATPLDQLMRFDVGTVATAAADGVAADLGGTPVTVGTPDRTRNITLEEVLDPAGNPVRAVINGRRFEDPVTERPVAGSVEDWRLINLTADSHPIHLHLVQFQVIDRRPIDVKAYTAALAAARAKDPDAVISPVPYYTGAAVRPEPGERGWKDTVRADPREVTRIRMRWDLPPGVRAPQRYVFHCHILEHEENDMMRPIEVVR